MPNAAAIIEHADHRGHETQLRGSAKAPSVLRLCRSRLHDLLYFLSRGFSRVASPVAHVADDLSGAMADLSRDVPSAVTDLFGHIACGVTDRSTSFFNLHAARQETAGKNKRKDNFYGRTQHFI
jgi:hypothetical protein